MMQTHKIKIVFMGTPDFAVPTLTKLYENENIDICFVVTKEDKQKGRNYEICESDVKIKAKELNIPILQPKKIKEDIEVIEKIKNATPDFIVVVAYGQILSKEILSIPKYACINGHASLLPKYRGASPIQTALLNGDKITGTTSMLMDVGLDTGDILKQIECDVSEKETAESLFEKLSVLTSQVLLDTILNFANIKPIKQDETKACKSKIINKENGLINFEMETAIDIERKIRAYTPWPSAYINSKDSIIKIWDADVIEDVNLQNAKEIGCNLYIYDNNLVAKCKKSYLKINILQKSGKNKISAKDFINGIK